MVKNTLEELKNKKNIHIVGAAGIEGSAIAYFLADQGIKNVILHDFSEKKDFENSFIDSRDYLTPNKAQEAYERLINTGYKINFKDSYLKDIEKADLIFISQGWFRYESNKKLKCLEGKIPFSSVTELYFQLSPCPIIGITGTVGKSTTTRLIYEMLKGCGKIVYISGNDRDNPPVLDKLLKFSKDAYLVLEVSNRQLINFNYSPYIAVVTNVLPNHPDDHKNFFEYIKVKSNIVTHQKEGDFAILNADNKEANKFQKLTPGEVFFFSVEKERKNGAYLKDNAIWLSISGSKGKLVEAKEIRLPGKHNILNIMAAILVGQCLKLDKKCIAKTLSDFKGLKHRLEFVGQKNKISFYEDSQSTSPYSTASAIEAFIQKKMILIMGGYRAHAKESDYSQTASNFFMPQVKAVFLIGKVAPIIQNEYFRQKRTRAHGPDIIRDCQILPKAMEEAAKIASPGDAVVLSPGAESFGEFKDYRDRGEKFKEHINDLF
jgi:UDP-N-acetylmuramoylalanine--D-glutamate ligase